VDLTKFWKECLLEIKQNVRKESFKTWFEPTRIKEITDKDVILITKKGEIHANFIEDKYSELISRVVSKKLGKKYRIRVDNTSKAEQRTIISNISISSLNKEFTFENFIVGQSNEFAHSAALAVAESPGTTRFNPLFIYGKAGLGKTHLLQAIGNYVIDEYVDKKVVCVSSSQFVEQYIKSIEMKKIDDFNNIYKTCDFLLMDDVQFLAGKQGTQETFFHIFNNLYNESKQIVLISDKFPKDLDGLEDRLISRFQSGLTVDIQPPNLETKIAIIYKKAQKNRLNLPENVIEYIARSSSPNIREMEGYLIKLLAYSSMYNTDIDYAKAIEILELKNDYERKTIYVEEVIDKVSGYYNISKEKIIKGNREKELILPRQIAMYLSRKMTNSSLKNIGKIFMKDHSTVIRVKQFLFLN
jgi:chromosomal replication initiator protein